MAKVLDLDVGERIAIDGGRVMVTLIKKSGRRAKLSVDAPPAIRVERLASVLPADVAGKGVARKSSPA